MIMSATNPLISVVIATRNRDDLAINAVDSILKNDYPLFEIWVVDQSTTDACERAMKKYEGDSRIIYQRISTVGMARARNFAIARSKGDLIAITDDDCVVDDQWLQNIYSAFAASTNLTILFGNVLPGDCEAAAGFIPSYYREQERTISSPLAKNDIDGLGACMAIRKAVWQELHGFDEMLGVGGLLKSSSEGDLVIHALHKGYEVSEMPSVLVTHNGFRTWEEGNGLIARYWYGTGAMYGKHLKLYPFNTFTTLALLAWRWAFGTSRVADSLGPNTQKIARLNAFVTGFYKGLSLKLDRKTGHFKAYSKKDAGSKAQKMSECL